VFDFAQRDGKKGKGMAGHTPAGCSSPAKHPTKNWWAAPLALPSSPGKIANECAASVGPLMASPREKACGREPDGTGSLHGRQAGVFTSHGPSGPRGNSIILAIVESLIR
jgi:hypothetical protein